VASRAAHTAAQPMLYPEYVLRRDLTAVSVGGSSQDRASNSGRARAYAGHHAVRRLYRFRAGSLSVPARDLRTWQNVANRGDLRG
jgi:hypothetical protein